MGFVKSFLSNGWPTWYQLTIPGLVGILQTAWRWWLVEVGTTMLPPVPYISITIFRLVGGIPIPLKNMKVSWDYEILYMEK